MAPRFVTSTSAMRTRIQFAPRTSSGGVPWIVVPDPLGAMEYDIAYPSMRPEVNVLVSSSAIGHQFVTDAGAVEGASIDTSTAKIGRPVVLDP